MDLLAFRYIQSKFPVGAISTRRFLCVQKRINFHTISSPIKFIKKKSYEIEFVISYFDKMHYKFLCENLQLC